MDPNLFFINLLSRSLFGDLFEAKCLNLFYDLDPGTSTLLYKLFSTAPVALKFSFSVTIVLISDPDLNCLVIMDPDPTGMVPVRSL